MPSHLPAKLLSEASKHGASRRFENWTTSGQNGYTELLANLLRCPVESHVCMKPRILIVDDETSILHTLADVFELSGYEAEVAASAGEAVSKIANRHYDAVLTDMRMERAEAG